MVEHTLSLLRAICEGIMSSDCLQCLQADDTHWELVEQRLLHVRRSRCTRGDAADNTLSYCLYLIRSEMVRRGLELA